MTYINNNKINGLGGIKRAYLNNTLIFQSFKKDEEVIPQYDITSTFNVTSTTSPTKLCAISSLFNSMYVDGVKIDVTSDYTFSTTGEHKVQYILKDNTTIGYNAFSDCSSLTSIEIPNSVTSIGNSVFYSCTSLSSIEIPNSVTSIGNNLFFNCTSLSSIELSQKLTSINPYTFYNCTSLTSVTIPDSVTSISSQSFRYCASLKSVTIGNSVTTIGDYAFLGCSSLSSITCYATTAPSLGSDVFNSLPSNGTLTYPCESDYSTWLSELGWENTCNSSKYDITSTFNVTSTNSPTQLCHSSAISYFTEMYVDGVQIDVSSGYTFNTTGEHTVQYMLADKTTIGDNAFFGCFNLKSVTINDSVETMSYRSFFNCNELTSVTIGSGVKTIGNQVFWNCLSLTSIDIPSSVETIGSSALGSCTSLTSVTIPSSVTSIGTEAFVNSLIHTDNFINNSSATGYPWGAIIYDKVQDDGLYISGTTVVKCKEDATNVTIPSSITNIGDEAFKRCYSLNEITCLATTAPTLNGTVFSSLPESGTLTYPCESDYSAWLEQLGWKDTCNQGGQEKWVTLTKDTDRSIKMQTFRIDTSTTPEISSGYYFITFSTSPDYPGENADLTYFSICINEDRIYDDYSRKHITEQKHIEGNVYEYTFSVPVYFAGGERNAPLSQVQYKTTSEDTPEEPGEVVSPYDITANFDADIKPFSTVLCFSAYTSAFTEMYIDGVLVSPTSAYTFSSTGEHTVGYMLKDKTTLAGNFLNGYFKGCYRMKEIKFKDELTTISGPAFSGCTRLQKVTFGSGLTSVGTNSGFPSSIFTGCTSLNSITCLAPTAPTLLKKSIQGVENNNGTLYVPQGSDYRTWTSILTTWNVQYLT